MKQTETEYDEVMLIIFFGLDYKGNTKNVIIYFPGSYCYINK